MLTVVLKIYFYLSIVFFLIRFHLNGQKIKLKMKQKKLIGPCQLTSFKVFYRFQGTIRKHPGHMVPQRPLWPYGGNDIGKL